MSIRKLAYTYFLNNHDIIFRNKGYTVPARWFLRKFPRVWCRPSRRWCIRKPSARFGKRFESWGRLQGNPISIWWIQRNTGDLCSRWSRYRCTYKFWNIKRLCILPYCWKRWRYVSVTLLRLETWDARGEANFPSFLFTKMVMLLCAISIATTEL